MRVAALLRGINIGPNRRIAMPELRSIVESIGHTDVETYLQSGNVVFTAASGPRRELVPKLEQALVEATRHEIAVVVRTGRELATVLHANPYPVADPTRLVVAFLRTKVTPTKLGLDDLASYAPDELTQIGSELYVSVPNGQAHSKLMETLVKRRQPTVVTVRNWRTVEALAELTASRA